MNVDRHDQPLAELGEALGAVLPADRVDVKTYTLGGERHEESMPLDGLERIGGRVAKAMRTIIEPYIRMRTTVTAEPLETVRFSDWRHARHHLISLSSYRSPALKGGFLLLLEGEWVSRLVDAFYGGTGGVNSMAPLPSDFSAGETRVAGRVADAIALALADGWSEFTALEPALSHREISVTASQLVRDSETVVVQGFVVDAGATGTTRIEIVYGTCALRQHAALAGARPHQNASPADHAFRIELARALAEVQLGVRSVLARPTLSVGELLALKPGDVIPISVGPRVPLLVANRRVADGTIGEQEGRAALMIEEIGRDA